MAEYFKIGKIVAITGLQGALILKHTLGKKTAFKGLATIFTDAKSSFFPWFLHQAKPKSDDEVIIQLEDINTPEQAKVLLQKEIWIPEEDFKKFSAKTAPISLLGYEVYNDNDWLGKILEVIELPHQIICKLMINDKEVLIPINESSVVNIIHKSRRVNVSLPDGLLEIYLQ